MSHEFPKAAAPAEQLQTMKPVEQLITERKRLEAIPSSPLARWALVATLTLSSACSEEARDNPVKAYIDGVSYIFESIDTLGAAEQIRDLPIDEVQLVPRHIIVMRRGAREIPPQYHIVFTPPGERPGETHRAAHIIVPETYQPLPVAGMTLHVRYRMGVTDDAYVSEWSAR